MDAGGVHGGDAQLPLHEDRAAVAHVAQLVAAGPETRLTVHLEELGTVDPGSAHHHLEHGMGMDVDHGRAYLRIEDDGIRALVRPLGGGRHLGRVVRVRSGTMGDEGLNCPRDQTMKVLVRVALGMREHTTGEVLSYARVHSGTEAETVREHTARQSAVWIELCGIVAEDGDVAVHGHEVYDHPGTSRHLTSVAEGQVRQRLPPAHGTRRFEADRLVHASLDEQAVRLHTSGILRVGRNTRTRDAWLAPWHWRWCGPRPRGRTRSPGG